MSIARIAVYAGSFDPATLGHVDLIERAANLFENVIVAIGVHPTKHPLFSAEERVALIAPQVDTVFLPTRTKHGFVSASLVREIASHGGDVSRYAPAVVCEALERKFKKA